jgi:ectoine hydroxylase-related dioxygenase (phytanoyl-CoA dioxygenase family)
MLTQIELNQWEADGYTIARGLFSSDEVARYRDHFMTLRGKGAYVGDLGDTNNPSDNDPLRKFPRMIHMHRWDDVSLQWLIDPRIRADLAALTGAGDPYAVQTMLYFKPAGARGQALHQDNFYLRAQPSTCIAAWLALDDCDEENGCMQIAVGSHKWPLLCTVQADRTQSFTDVTVPLPPGQEVRPVLMKAGDVLYFNGQVVHGSFPNTSADRFRRALIGHYIAGDAQSVYEWYHPVLTMDGTPLEFAKSPDGSVCGVWTDKADGRVEIAMTDIKVGATRSE